MKTVQITRTGDEAITEQLAGMHRWLEREGIHAFYIRSTILGGRVIYTATFKHDADADCFVRAFGHRD